MKNYIITTGLVFILLVSLCGCAAVLIGAGAIGGYAISKDSVTGEIDANFEQVWDKSIKAANDMGAVNLENKKQGRIEAEIKMSKVVISIDELNKNTTRLTVGARKNLLPNTNLASKVFLKIYKSIK